MNSSTVDADYNVYKEDGTPVYGGNCDCKNCDCVCCDKKSNRLLKTGGTKQKNIDGKKSKKIAGVDRVVHQTKKGKKFVIRVNKKTGKRYQEYIKDLRKTKKNKPTKKTNKKVNKKSKKTNKKTNKKTGRR